jgi:hypothetical protein
VLPCIRIGLQLGSQSEPAVKSLLSQIAALIIEAAVRPSLHDLATTFMLMVSESLPRFSRLELMSPELQKICETVPKLPAITGNRETLLNALKFISVWIENFERFSNVFSERPCSTFLLEAFTKIPVDQGIYEVLMSIKTQQFVRLAIDVMKGTEFGGPLLKVLVSLSRNSSNAFEYFHSGVLSFALECTEDPNLCPSALELFRSIGTFFFSPLALDDFIKQFSKGNSQLHLLDSMLQMILHDSIHLPSFFHFPDHTRSGIFGPATTELNEQWSFVTHVRVALTSCDFLILTDENVSTFEFRFVEKKLSFWRREGGRILAHGVFRFAFELQKWHRIVLIYSPRSITLVEIGRAHV